MRIAPLVNADLRIVGIALLHHRGQRHSDVVGIFRLWLPSPDELEDLEGLFSDGIELHHFTPFPSYLGNFNQPLKGIGAMTSQEVIDAVFVAV